MTCLVLAPTVRQSVKVALPPVSEDCLIFIKLKLANVARSLASWSAPASRLPSVIVRGPGSSWWASSCDLIGWFQRP